MFLHHTEDEVNNLLTPRAVPARLREILSKRLGPPCAVAERTPDDRERQPVGKENKDLHFKVAVNVVRKQKLFLIDNNQIVEVVCAINLGPVLVPREHGPDLGPRPPTPH